MGQLRLRLRLTSPTPGVPCSEEVRFSAPGGPVLAGTLALPPGGPLGSAVLLIGGSGPTERTNDGFFEPVRARLLERGAAVLTYDKRGAGRSTGAGPRPTSMSWRPTPPPVWRCS